MIRRFSLSLGCLLLTLACVGCDGTQNAFRTAEDRINEAFPIDAGLTAAASKYEVSVASNSEALSTFKVEYANKLKVRALNCAGGFVPGTFESAEEIRNRLGKPECFREADAQLLRWVGARRLEALLMGPALRPVPTESRKMLTSNSDVAVAYFAEAAGVVLMTSRAGVDIVDAGTDEPIFREDLRTSYVSRAALSPNGRVYAIAGRSSARGAQLRETATGELLIEYPDIIFMQWLDDLTALIDRDNKSELLDLRTGSTVPLKGIGTSVRRVLRLPREDGVFIAPAPRSFTRFQLKRSEDRVSVSLLAQSPSRALSSENPAALTSDGRFVVQAVPALTITDTQTLATEEINMTPYSIEAIVALPDPKEVLLTLHDRSGSARRLVVFDVNDRTFAPVEDARLPATAALPFPRISYASALHRVAVVSGYTVTLLEGVERSFKMDSQPYLQYLQQKDREALRQANLDARALAAVGSLGEGAARAQVEAVGVYESAAAPSGPGRRSARGPVLVRVRRSAQPIVLVLSSYEPVDWRLAVESGADLAAVLVSGNVDSSVSGAGSKRITRIGNAYAYEQSGSGMSALQRQVELWVGKRIDIFQGAYKANAFSVGGQ